MKYRGVVVPMVTPFTPAGHVDEPAIGRIVQHLVGNGIGGTFPLGTTGECASIPREDRSRVVEATVKDSAGHAETRGEPITVSESPLILTAVPEGGTLMRLRIPVEGVTAHAG